jgi:ubiquinone/menaquinone biosynthesis C-methylase UbiE
VTLSETERVRTFYDRSARQYDATIRIVERALFGDGRAWVCSRARGDVLEIGIGTGRNLPYYPAGVRLVGMDLSLAMLAIARHRADELRVAVDLRHGDAQSLAVADESSTPWSARSPCARSRTIAGQWRRPRGCCGPAAGSSSWSTCAVRLGRCASGSNY